MRHVVVDGRVVVRDRELVTIDVPALLAEVREATAAVRATISG